MNSEQQIERGQAWERKKDGTRVEIKNYDSRFDDVRYRVLKPKGRYGAIYGFIYGSYLRSRYVLVSTE